MFIIPFKFGPPINIEWVRLVSVDRTLFVPVQFDRGSSVVGKTYVLVVTNTIIGVHLAKEAYSKLIRSPIVEVHNIDLLNKATSHPVLTSLGEVHKQPSSTRLPIYFMSSTFPVKAKSMSYVGNIEEKLVLDYALSLFYGHTFPELSKSRPLSLNDLTKRLNGGYKLCPYFKLNRDFEETLKTVGIFK